MSRQWDTQRQFKPNYRGMAGMVFLGWWRVLTTRDWLYAARGLSDSLLDLGGLLIYLAAALLMLVFSPIVLPIACLYEARTQRRNRLFWIKRNRAADKDI